MHRAGVIGGGQIVGGVGEADEVGGHQTCSLVEQLVEGVLAVGTRLAPEDLAGVGGHVLAVGLDRLTVGLHRQLLQVRGEACHVVRIGEHHPRLCVPEVRVPESDQCQQYGRVALQRLSTEMSVDGVESAEEFGEAFLADRRHHRETDRGIHRIAAAHPVPEAEHVDRVDSEVRHGVRIGADGGEVLGDGVLTRAEFVQQPPLGGSRVGQRLQRREGFRRDDEQRLLGIEVGECRDHVGRVDIGHEVAADVGIDVVAQRAVHHDGPEVGAADADVDDIGDGFSGVALPLSAAQLVGECAHRVKHLVDVVHNILAVDDELRVGGEA
ncbi:Uncharacterised protein [Mycobacteroides abscessus subsp. abscessus]|nr:Uncharacterised protein [Mycobacteroides abscessus subsp. abscessus]